MVVELLSRTGALTGGESTGRGGTLVESVLFQCPFPVATLEWPGARFGHGLLAIAAVQGAAAARVDMVHDVHKGAFKGTKKTFKVEAIVEGSVFLAHTHIENVRGKRMIKFMGSGQRKRVTTTRALLSVLPDPVGETRTTIRHYGTMAFGFREHDGVDDGFETDAARTRFRVDRYFLEQEGDVLARLDTTLT